MDGSRGVCGIDNEGERVEVRKAQYISRLCVLCLKVGVLKM